MVAREVGATPAQVALAWVVRSDVLPSPVRTRRGLSNLGALQVTLSDEQVAQLEA